MFWRHGGCEGRSRRFAHDPLGFGGRHGGRADGDGGRMGGHTGSHTGRMRGGRVLDQGDLRYVMLGLIAERPRHGYELMKAIEERLGGSYSPSPGVIYPTLTLLEELGYIAVEAAASGGARKLYAITAEGTEFLALNRVQTEAVFARMDEVARAVGGGPAPEIRRAVHNLRGALAVRLAKGALSEAQVGAITAVLDRAAGEIERS